MKKCKICQVEKPRTEFNNNKQSKDGLQSKCKICKSIYESQWYKSNTERKKKTTIKWSKLKSGVYAIFENGKCLYVGETSRLNGRISDHKTWIKNPSVSNNISFYNKLSNHKSYIIGVVEECSNHKEREKYWINKLKPLYNEKQWEWQKHSK